MTDEFPVDGTKPDEGVTEKGDETAGDGAAVEQAKAGNDEQGDEAAQLAAWNDLLEEESGNDSSPSKHEEENSSQLDIILEIPVTISLEIGRTAISIRNLLQLNQGSVVELDRLAGEPLDVMVNGCLVAHGEVVMVNEKFGIRLTDIISPAERVRKLR
ncbi:MAG TPA: flagellar motor switch protein FliN [Gammaproteobacteria bacterium]|nr:flagellar motor switch protein FliN [Gammaproteobacteria bacterium]